MKKCNTGCNIQQDGIDTDLLYLLPREVYGLMKRRARIKSDNHFNDRHKNHFKKMALRKKMALIEYLMSLSSEVEPYIKVIQTMQDGGVIDEELNQIAEDINERINEINSEYESKKETIQEFKKGGLPKYQDGTGSIKSQIEQDKRINQRRRLYNDNIASRKGYESTGFRHVKEPSEILEADSCYVLTGSIPKKVDCSNKNSVKGSELKTEDGKTYFMREEIKYNKTVKEGDKSSKDWSTGDISTSDGGDSSDTNKGGNNTDKSNKTKPNNDDWKKSCGACGTNNPMTLGELETFTSNGSYSQYVTNYLNQTINSIKKAGGVSNTPIIMAYAKNMNNMEEAALNGCFCATGGKIDKTREPEEKIEADRKVDVVSEEDSKPTKDNVNKYYFYYADINIPIPKSVTGRDGGMKRDTAYIAIEAIIDNGEYKGFRLAKLGLNKSDLNNIKGIAGGISKGDNNKGNNNLGSITTKVPTSTESTNIFGKENTSFITSFITNSIQVELANLKPNIDSWIADKVSKSKDSNLEEKEYEVEDKGTYSNQKVTKNQQGGQYPIGKEFLARSMNRGRDRNIQEYLKNYAVKVSPEYFK